MTLGLATIGLTLALHLHLVCWWIGLKHYSLALIYILKSISYNKKHIAIRGSKKIWKLLVIFSLVFLIGCHFLVKTWTTVCLFLQIHLCTWLGSFLHFFGSIHSDQVRLFLWKAEKLALIFSIFERKRKSSFFCLRVNSSDLRYLSSFLLLGSPSEH